MNRIITSVELYLNECREGIHKSIQDYNNYCLKTANFLDGHDKSSTKRHL